MQYNIEIKAKIKDPTEIRRLLLEVGAFEQGTDRQTDTYFNCNNGRLKLRQGKIETALIHYHRKDSVHPSASDVLLYHPNNDEALKATLEESLGVSKVVVKQREIFFIANVKFHLDSVDGLGSYIEIEAMGKRGLDPEDRLKAQCEHYMNLFGIEEDDLVAVSYSDLIED